MKILSKILSSLISMTSGVVGANYFVHDTALAFKIVIVQSLVGIVIALVLLIVGGGVFAALKEIGE